MIAALRSAAFAGVLLAPVAAAAGPVFTEHAAALGIDHRYTGGWEHFVGGGVAVFDCDGDDRPEIFAAGGASPAVLLRNRTVGGAFAFAEETPEALTRTGVTGAYPVDIDSDGQPDLAILSVGENVLMRGLPDCRFEPFEIGFASSARWTTAFSATWEGDAQLPTLAFGNYVDRANPDGPFEACDANRLYRPDGARYTGSVPLMPGFCA
ncbi:MAG: VCBS repeat-containing protein, partial [Pseudomonadota bacterium]